MPKKNEKIDYTAGMPEQMQRDYVWFNRGHDTALSRVRKLVESNDAAGLTALFVEYKDELDLFDIEVALLEAKYRGQVDEQIAKLERGEKI